MSLSFAGELADKGLSLLIFPEGRHVPEGTIQPPERDRDLRSGSPRPGGPRLPRRDRDRQPDDAWWPRIHKTRLVIGRPLRIDPDAEAGATARRLEAAVHELGNESSRVQP